MNFLRRKRTEILMLLFMCGIYFFSYFQRVGIPGTIFDQLQRDFTASAAGVAALGSIFLYIYGGIQLFVGMLADRCGGARTLIAGGLLMSIGAVLFPLAQTLPMLYVTRALVATGSGMIFISIVKEVDELFEARHFAVILGTFLVLGYSGGLAATYPLDRAVAVFGWRRALLAAGIMSSIALVATYVMLKYTGHLRRICAVVQPRGFLAILRNADSLPVMTSHAINFSIYFLFQAAIGKKMLVDCCGLSQAGASSITSLMMGLIMVMTFIAGPASRLIGNRRKPILVGGTFITMAASIAMSASLIFSPNPGWLAAGLSAISISAGCSVIFISTMKEVNPPEAAGTSTGLINGVVYLVVAALTHAAGFAMDMFREQAVQTGEALIYPANSYAVIMCCCAGMAALSFVSSLRIRESRSISVYANA